MEPTSSVHAMVTGATGGIGRGICFALIEQARRDGASIFISAAASRPGRVWTSWSTSCAPQVPGPAAWPVT